MSRKLIIDTDTAGDDSTAILTALHFFDVLGVTVVGGNISFDQMVENALYTLELAQTDQKIPVYKEHPDPIMTLEGDRHQTEERIFASDGMGGANFPKAQQRPEDQHAVDFIIESIHRYPGQLEIAAIGPLTNIAMAIKRDPSIISQIKHLWIMGGTNHAPGNINAGAEFNFYTDPEAVKIVLHSGIDMTMVTWEQALRHAVMYDDDLADIEALNSKGSEFFLKVNLHTKAFEFKKRGVDGVTCPDSVTLALAANPDLISQATSYYVDIELKDGLTKGYNIVDVEGDLGKPANIRVVEAVDGAKFKQVLLEVLANIN
ncbi:ribosylpyrimidine nucleosidase [Aerococcus urinaehominis]|uniref:Ribosylpyrimidine nucleosidase n=1 Tax=Aerococcus urinaehominis TaxID=128944 RepID=A0A0X8FJY4_9LACT|nr:nucleoside hydrolase [Aerococcus urinaehominis]AMB98684.1 ribosylpyrimidine nucleosidase [Aerococcus urinaehominis]SDL98585.1 purine nucleosidase [Aerococcus urinaehominis]